MKEIMKKLRYAAAVVAGMFALAAQAEEPKTYYLAKTDSKSSSSFTNVEGKEGAPGGWSTTINGTGERFKVDTTKEDTYILPSGRELRILSDVSTFGNVNLVFAGGGFNAKFGSNKTVEIPKLTVTQKTGTDDSYFNHGDGKYTYTLAGENWEIKTGTLLGFNVTADGNNAVRTFALTPTISGTGTLKFFTDISSLKINSASKFTLSGDFSGFTGDINIEGCQQTSVTVSNVKAFGADPVTGVNYVTIKGSKNAINTSTDGVQLIFGNFDYTSGPNRIWDFGTAAAGETITMPRISVSSKKTLEIQGIVEGSAGLKTAGTGTIKFTHGNLNHYTGTTIFTGNGKTISAGDLKIMSDITKNWAPFVVENPNWNAPCLTVTLKRGLTLPGTIKVAYSSSEDAESIEWNSDETLSVSFAEGQTSITGVQVAPPEGTRFVRFQNLVNGVRTDDCWSNVIDLDELAGDDDPQVKLADLTISETSVTGAVLSVNLVGLGYGATAADLTVFYTHDDLPFRQKKFAENRSELGTIPFTLENLKPNTTYRVYLSAENGVDGGEVRIPEADGVIEFATQPEPIGNRWLVARSGSWEHGPGWTQTESTFGNLILGKMPSRYENSLSAEKTDSGAAATDGKFPTTSSAEARYFGVDDACIVEWTLDKPSTITAVRLLTSGEDSRGKISVEEVVATVNGSDQKISSMYCSTESSGANHAYLLPSAGQALVNDATAVRIRFTDGVNSEAHISYKAYFSEIEVIGFDSGYSKSIEVTDSSWDGSTLMAMLSRDAGGAASEIFACYGTAYGGDEKTTWQNRVKVGEFAAGATQAAAVFPNVPADTLYVRLLSDKDGWSESFFLPDMQQSESTALLADVLSIRQPRETSVSFAGYFTALGANAEGGFVVAEYKSDEETEYGHCTVIWSTTATDFTPSASLDLVLRGLAPETHYAIRLRAKNDQGVVTKWREFEATTGARGLIDATIAGDESYVTKNLDTMERVLIFKNGAQAATFTVEKAGYAEVLLVGGGGGGGTDGGTNSGAAGGGAGGYLHYDNIFFPAGTYTITVGAGGAKGESGYGGSKGGDTTITYAGEGEFETITAYGGGGGDVQRTDRLTKEGPYGSTGGAGGSRNAQTDKVYLGVYQPTTNQGNYGGDGVSNYGGGGGGAGAKGAAATTQGGVYFGGVGGNGLPSAITDEVVYYAGGGGACAAYGGAGGLGGGGSGCGYRSASDFLAGTNGTDGFGGGGGGGMMVNNVATSGNGGCGTVILRFMPESDDLATAPAVQLRSAAPMLKDGVPGVDVTYRVCSEGDGSVVTVDFEYGADEKNLDHTVRLQNNAALGDYDESLTGLRAGVVYFGRVVVTDEKGTSSHSRALQFTTLDGTDTVEPDAPRFGAFTYSTRNSEHKVEITATGSNFDFADDKTTSVKFYAGFDPLSLVEMNAVIESVADNEIKIFCDAINFDAAYYGALLVDNGEGVSRSQPFAFSAPGQSVLLSSTYSIEQTAITFKGNVKSLGAGVTKARLYVSTVNANQLELLDEIEITETGDFEFEPHEFDWDQTVYYRIDVANSFGTSSSWVSAGTAGNKKITEDRAEYTWNPEKNGGLWHDAANWTVTGAARGYPTRYATAQFPSGTSSENMVESEINVNQSQEVGFINWGFSHGTVTFIGVGTTMPEVKMPEGSRTFNFGAGTHANVVLDHIKMCGTGGNNSVYFGNYNTLTLKNGALMTDFGGGSQWNLTGTSNRLTITDGSRVALANATHNLSGADSRIEVTDGGTFEHLTGGTLNLTGTGTALVINNGTFNAAQAVTFSGNNTSSAKIVLAGETPSIIGAGAITAANGVTGRIEFMVPVNGYETVPMVRDSGFNASTGTGKIVLAVPTDAPAATAETDLEVVLISSPNGITTTNFELAELPHPDEDGWIWTNADGTEAGEGETVTGLKVHLVGRPFEPAAPVARGLHVKSSTAATDDETADATVTFEADFRRGGSSSSATWFYKLDDETELAAIGGTFDQVENVKELTIEGLEKGSKHVLHLKGVSDGGESVTDYAFGTIGEVAELGAVTGVTAEPYGPYTRFVANASAKGTFTVLVAHEAEIDFGDGKPTKFTLNTGTYTIKGLTLANEGGVIYSAPVTAEQMIVKVQTAEVKNEPTFGVAGLAVNAEGKVVVSLDVMGFGGTLTKPENPPESFAAKFVWGYLPEKLVYECELGTVEALGAFAGTPLDLPESTLIYAKVVCDNKELDGSAESDVFAYTIPGAGDEGDGALYQATATVAWKTDAWNILDVAKCQTRGPMAAICGNTAGTGNNTWKDIGGNACDNWKDNTTFGYVGYMKIDSTTISFGGGIDDNCVIKIFPQNTALTDLTTVEPLFTSGDFSGNGWHASVCDTLPKAGWYPVEIRVGNGTGSYGPYNSTTYRLRYNLTGATAENDTKWMLMNDSGDGSLFSTFAPMGDAPKFDESAPFVGDLVLDASKGVALDAVFTAENAATYAAFRTAATEDMAGAVLTAAEATTGEDGKTTLTLTGLTPGAEFYVQVVAYAAEGEKCFATYPRLVTMPTAATFTTAPTVTSEQNTLTVTGSVLPGAGETWVIGEFTVGGVTTEVTLGHWAVGAGKTFTLNWSKAFENAWDQSVEYKITLKNSVVGTDYEWTAAPISGSQTITDGATYTWTGASEAEGAKLWNDAANWTSDKETGVGYPTANSVARFVTANTPDVELDQDRTVKDLTIETGARVAFSGKHTFTLAKDLTLNAPRVTFGAVNEATVRIVGTFTANKANITNIVDNATLHVNSFKVNDNSYTLLISGAAPQIISRGHFGVCRGYTGASIQLTVPENGWTAPVIVCNGETTPNKKFGYTDQNDSTASFAFVVDPASPFLERGVTKTMTIVDSAFFFSVDNMVFDDNDKPVVTCASDRVTECSFAFNNEDPTLARTLLLTLCGKVPVAEYKGVKYYSVAEAMEAAAKDSEPGAIKIIADSSEEISGEVKDFDSSKEVVFVKENEEVVPVVQTSTAIMQAVTVTASADSDPVALTANTPKLREFLTANGVAAYTAAKTSAEAISTALAAVPTVEGNNGLALWKDYALGIEPTTSVKAVADAAKDTDLNAITLSIPTLKGKVGSGDFTIKYQVVDRAGKEETRTTERADAIKIPLATGIYDVKIVFEPAHDF